MRHYAALPSSGCRNNAGPPLRATTTRTQLQCQLRATEKTRHPPHKHAQGSNVHIIHTCAVCREQQRPPPRRRRAGAGRRRRAVRGPARLTAPVHRGVSALLLPRTSRHGAYNAGPPTRRTRAGGVGAACTGMDVVTAAFAGAAPTPLPRRAPLQQRGRTEFVHVTRTYIPGGDDSSVPKIHQTGRAVRDPLPRARVPRPRTCPPPTSRTPPTRTPTAAPEPPSARPTPHRHHAASVLLRGRRALRPATGGCAMAAISSE